MVFATLKICQLRVPVPSSEFSLVSRPVESVQALARQVDFMPTIETAKVDSSSAVESEADLTQSREVISLAEEEVDELRGLLHFLFLIGFFVTLAVTALAFLFVIALVSVLEVDLRRGSRRGRSVNAGTGNGSGGEGAVGRRGSRCG